MGKNETRGGRRENAGRPKLNVKKKAVKFWVALEHVDQLKVKVKEFLKQLETQNND